MVGNAFSPDDECCFPVVFTTCPNDVFCVPIVVASFRGGFTELINIVIIYEISIGWIFCVSFCSLSTQNNSGKKRFNNWFIVDKTFADDKVLLGVNASRFGWC